MVHKDRSKTITFRDKPEIVELFEALVEADEREQVDIIRELYRDWVTEQCLTEDAMEALVDEIDEDIRDLQKEVRRKQKEIEELKERKEKLRELAEEADTLLKEEEEKEEEQEDWNYSIEELQEYVGKPRGIIPEDIEAEMEERGFIGGDNA